ncbi:MAG: glycogen-binding domain-containing protein [Treponema sp.]|nr:glycogen-binding domain-containing protein [Treponema sp.]
MKTIYIFVILLLLASFPAETASASEWETYDVVNRLLSIQAPSAPVIQDNWAIFTADSSIRRVGIAFAHEDFATVYWFRQLQIPNNRINPVILPGEKFPSSHMDSGIKFHVQKIPDHARELEYRLVIDGLWTVDPYNDLVRRDPVSGLTLSVLRLPQRQVRPNPLDGLPAGLNFTYIAPPGESVYVAGTFNSWDPFMYELREGPAGVYSLVLPLPPGTYHYVFFHRGQRHADPYNPRRVYARDGSAASEIVVP